MRFNPFLGSSPDSGQSLVEWGDFAYVRPSIRTSIRPPLWAIQPGLKPETWLAGWLGLRPGWLGLRPGWMAQRGERTDRRTDKWSD